MRHFSWLAAIFLTGSMLTGCQNSQPTTPASTGDGKTGTKQGGEDAGAANAETPGQAAVKPAIPILKDVTSLEGNWVLSPYLERRLTNFWIFRVSPADDGKWNLESVSALPLMGEFKPSTIQVDGNAIQFDVQLSNPNAQVKQGTLRFEGKLKDGVVLGSLMFPDTGIVAPAQLLPTDADNLEEYQEWSPVEGSSEIDQAMKEPDPGRNLWKVASARPTSPLATEAYGFLFTQIQQWNFTDDEIRKLAGDYQLALSNWGDRLQGISEITAGSNLARFKKALNVADELLTAGEQRIGELKTAENMMKAGRLHLRIGRDQQAIVGKDEAAAAAAYADLQELNKELAFNRPDLLLATAEYAEKHDQKDVAIEQYLTLVAVPLLERMALSTRIGMVAGDPTPTSALKALWTEKHGSLDGLKEKVIETYHAQVTQLLSQVKEKTPAFPDANAEGLPRTVLTEVFTNTFCEPCVAADLAVDLLVQTQPQDRSVILCYHQQNPGPDPLTSADSEERATSYNIQGTPSVFVNGAQINGTGGLFGPDFLMQSYLRCRQAIDHFMKQPTQIKLEPKATVENGNLTIEIPAITGIPESELNNVRLRLAVAEESVDYRAPNGLRQHPMVVRTMLGGNKGIAAKQGELKYRLSMPVAELQHRQLAYLFQYEHGKRMKFPEKPAVMKKLRLVAFVQHDKTREVLQASWTPITGEWEYPEIKFADPDGHDHSAEESDAKSTEGTPSEAKPATEENSESKPPAASPKADEQKSEVKDAEDQKSDSPAAEEKPAGNN